MTGDETGRNTGPAFTSEIEHGHDEYSAEELLEQSQLNAQALMLGMFHGLEENPEMLSRLTTTIAETFLRGWDADRPWEPVEILDALLTNYRAMGGEIDAYDPASTSPNATVVGLPNADLTDQLRIPATAFRPMLMVSERLVELLGCELEWSHDAAESRIRLQINTRS